MIFNNVFLLLVVVLMVLLLNTYTRIVVTSFKYIINENAPASYQEKTVSMVHVEYEKYEESGTEEKIRFLKNMWSSLLEQQREVSISDFAAKPPHLVDCKQNIEKQIILDSRTKDGKLPPWTISKGLLGIELLEDKSNSTNDGLFIPWVAGADEDNLPLTRRVQHDIWLNQHPENCSNAKFLVATWWGDQEQGSVGVGSELVSMAQILGVALREKRVLITMPYHGAKHQACTGSNYGRWSCYFAPEASEECIDHALKHLENKQLSDRIIMYQGGGWGEGAPSIWGSPWKSMQKTVELDGELIVNYPKEHMRWWRAQALRYLMRYPSQHLCECVNIARQEAFGDIAAKLVINLPPATTKSSSTKTLQRLAWSDYGPWLPRPLVSIHVRQGDKDREMVVHPFEDYMKLAFKLRRHFPQVKHVWLSTEMQNVIEESKHYTNWKFYYTNITRQRGRTPMSVYMDSLGKEKTFTNSFVNLMMASEADFFIGALGSTWCYIIDGMRMTSGKTMAGFLTVNPFNKLLD